LNSEYYYAHVDPKNGLKRKPELLNEHILLVQKKFESLVNIHRLDPVIDKLIENLLSECGKPSDVHIINFIKKAWVDIVVYHDFGKVNENFQANPDKMNNDRFKGLEKKDSPLNTTHSSLGAYLYLVKHLDEIKTQVNVYHEILTIVCLTFSYSIFRHHSPYLGDTLKEKVSFNVEEVNCMKQYVDLFQWNIDAHFLNIVPLNTTHLFELLNGQFKCFSLYSLNRLIFSLLTASDYLASGEYMTGIEIEEKEFGVLTRARVDSIYNFVSTAEWLDSKNEKVNFNKATFGKVKENYIYQNPRERSNKNLNILREEMGVEVVQKIRQNYSRNLFYIEAPTGGGKTNLSFIATIELLKKCENLNKVFYVFPFTTLITQTQKSLLEAFGLHDDEIIMLSSKSGFKERIEIEDDQYGNQRRFYLDNLFCFFPFCMLTHISFFNILKTNIKEENYLLHRIANSVVVIDELQAYSPQEWDKVLYFIKTYSHFYNIKFIVMSATLPKLGSLDILRKYDQEFTYLIDNAKVRYFQNPNFSQRVSFNLDLLKIKNLQLEVLVDKVLSCSKEYSLKDFGEAKPKGSVYTIIEFIFKKTATEFYQLIKDNVFFDDIFVLSGTILEHRRKYIINFLKNKENRKKKILLITTQVVEAGVDIDMDLGFKDKSLIDSDEQLAGRINRNVNKSECILYLFNYNNEKILYGKDKRFENTKLVSNEEYLEILETKDFDRIYNKVLEGINKNNQTEGFIGLDEYEMNIKHLRFQSVNNQFQLIDKRQDNLSIFIPLNVPVKVEGTENTKFDFIFSTSELAFLNRYKIYPNGNNEIEGDKVYDLYLKLTEFKLEITDKLISNKILQGIMSKFIIQLIGSNKLRDQIFSFIDRERCVNNRKENTRGSKNQVFECLNKDWEKIYDEKFGLNDFYLNSVETQFL